MNGNALNQSIVKQLSTHMVVVSVVAERVVVMAANIRETVQTMTRAYGLGILLSLSGAMMNLHILWMMHCLLLTVENHRQSISVQTTRIGGITEIKIETASG